MKPAVAQSFREDLEAALQFLEEGNYPRVTVQANRMITAAALWGDQPTFAAAGLAMRLAAIQVRPGTASEGMLEFPQKEALALLIRKLREFSLQPHPGDASFPWKALAECHEKFWAGLRPRLEGKAYTKNIDFVNEVLEWASRTLGESWKLIAEPTGSPFLGVVNEVERVIKAHGANERQLAQYGLIAALSWYADYAKWQSKARDGNVDSRKVSDILAPRVDGVLTLLRGSAGDDTFFNRVAETSLDLLRAWRTDFAKYYDLFLTQERRGREVVFEAAPKEREEAPKGRRKKA